MTRISDTSEDRSKGEVRPFKTTTEQTINLRCYGLASLRFVLDGTPLAVQCLLIDIDGQEVPGAPVLLDEGIFDGLNTPFLLDGNELRGMRGQPKVNITNGTSESLHELELNLSVRAVFCKDHKPTSSSSDNRPCGVGIFFDDDDSQFNRYIFLKSKIDTQRRAELRAAILAETIIENLHKYGGYHFTSVTIETDSTYLYNGIKGVGLVWSGKGYENHDNSPIINEDLWDEYRALGPSESYDVGWEELEEDEIIKELNILAISCGSQTAPSNWPDREECWKRVGDDSDHDSFLRFLDRAWDGGSKWFNYGVFDRDEEVSEDLPRGFYCID
ncbi:hypothetical protein AA313_de0203625 [Arthrobotrys entomopaga]|nr:hypothetical protein AA313_de0203625 [Arthrobotrys entomopaga]